ncbi:hypothetical protein WJT74_05220 [Sphingomicrobium sp. XHP0239]|uniref:hypothetical protein n=1 Tax=Sphingomicrobium maritimum TaxID=3133972 RepID=UPI0031CC93E7
MDQEDLKNIAAAAFPQPVDSTRDWPLDKFNEHIDERIDRKVNKLVVTVMLSAFGVILSVIVGAWHVSNELRDAVVLADKSDQRLDQRALWMQRQEQHDREQDRVLRQLDPTYQPPGFRETPL